MRIDPANLGAPNKVDVRNYGAFTDSTTTTAAFQAAIDDVYSLGGGVVEYWGNYHLNSITIKRGVHLKGPHPNPGAIKPGASANYGAGLGVLWVNSASSITNEGSLSGGVIIREGMTTPFADATAAVAAIAAFSGTAVLHGANDASTFNNLFLGFAWSVKSIGYERPHIFNNRSDGTNGFQISDCSDIAMFKNNHCWPFLTTSQTWSNDIADLGARSGKAYVCSKISGPVGGDWNRVLFNFSYGYIGGLEIDSCNDVLVIGSGHDHQSALAPASSGVAVIGTSNRCMIVNSQAASQQTSFLFNATGNNFLRGCSGWSADAYHVRVITGGVIINGNSFDSAPYGVAVDATADFVDVDYNVFNNIVNLSISIGGNTDAHSVGENNRYIDSPEGIAPTRFGVSTKVTRASSDTTGFLEIARKARGTRASLSTVLDGDTLRDILTQAYDGTAYRSSGLLRWVAEGTPSGSKVPARLEWWTSGASDDFTRRMVLSSSGRLGINEASPDYPLDVNGAIGFAPGSSVTPVDNGDVVFQLTSNTSFQIKAKGSDGVVRTSASIALS